MTSKRKSRDSQGRFIPGTSEDDIQLPEVPNYRFWTKIKTLIFFTLMLLLSLPWSVISSNLQKIIVVTWWSILVI
jgi:hypothetical protein